jgi:hypothetical protein
MPEQGVLGMAQVALREKRPSRGFASFLRTGSASTRTGGARRKSRKLGGNWFSLRLSADGGRRSVAGYTEGRPLQVPRNLSGVAVRKTAWDLCRASSSGKVVSYD